MQYPHGPADGLSAGDTAKLRHSVVRQDTRARRPAFLTRRYDIQHLCGDGDIGEMSRIAPAIPLFEEAFAAFARGCLIATPDGPVAVEDLVPGQMVETVGGAPEPLVWIGSMTIAPGAHPDRAHDQLYRVTSGRFGLDRTMPDLMLGPHARLLHRVTDRSDTEAALIPVASFVDGNTVIEVTPRAPVRVYHLAMRGHRLIRANGVPVETFHPGARARISARTDYSDIFLSLFPHVRYVADFGPLACPRLTSTDHAAA